MTKYDYNLKKKIVSAYLNGEGGYKYLSRVYGPNRKDIKRWVKNYQAFGEESLKNKKKAEEYTFEKKLSVVKFYLSNEISYMDLAIKEGIRNESSIVRWVKQYRTGGADALKSSKKGSKEALSKPKKEILNEEKIVDTSVEHVKRLEAELLKLRIENAFLKERRRLRLEEEAKTRERLKSLTVSEENSN